MSQKPLKKQWTFKSMEKKIGEFEYQYEKWKNDKCVDKDESWFYLVFDVLQGDSG